jgi:copper chaperone CopZ
MKRAVKIVFVVAACLWYTVAAAEVYVLQVEGMGCRLCAYSIEHRLGQLEGVQEVRVDHENGEVVVRTRNGASVTEEQARDVIHGAGFKLIPYEELVGTEQRSSLRLEPQGSAEVLYRLAIAPAT